ncbi:MAG: hypothetical protein KJ767_03185, partial [Nanoarchaeota archaeon]|nr:hypothetical protein [Nanoarchaeota archaeon]
MIEDVNIEAEIRGIETGTVDVETPLFDIREDDDYSHQTVVRKYLTLKIPANINLGDDITDEYTLRIRASSDKTDETWNIDLEIERPRHNLVVLDTQSTIYPVSAGDTALVEVVVRNRGSKVLEDVFVKVSIPELGISKQKYLRDLAPLEEPTDFTDFDDDLTDKAVAYVRLEIPTNAVSGDYTVNIKAYSLDNVVKGEDTSVLTVKGISAGTAQTSVIADATTKSVAREQGVVYKVMITNLGNTAQVYNAELLGVNFGTSSVNPAVISLTPGATGEFNVFVSPSNTATLGAHNFNVVVKSGAQTVKTLNLNADVTQGATTDKLKQNLIVIAVILVVILIILAIIIAVVTGRRPEEEKLY